MKKIKKVCISGMGYIGLPLAALLTNKDYFVHGVEIDESIINLISKGEIHIAEPDLDNVVKTAVKSKKLTVDKNPIEADVFIIAVPTPFHKDLMNKNTNSPKPNTDFIFDAIKKILPYLTPGNLIILESTSPVGTTDLIAEFLIDQGVDLESIFLAHSPERVLPGQIMKELLENDRVVGGINNNSTQMASKFYRSFIKGSVMETNAKTAEMVKLTENSFRDVNLAFANELSILCDDIDIDVTEVISLSNRHPRVNILNPGCGVGGHCISVDPWFIVDTANGNAKLIEQARRTNDHKADWVVERVIERVKKFQEENGRLPSMSCMGLTFKANSDDLRQSPAVYISKKLNELFKIQVVEPNILIHKFLNLVDYKKGLLADICIYLVAHREFDPSNLKKNDLDFCGLND